MRKSIIGATCACLSVLSINVNAASVSYFEGANYYNNVDFSIRANSAERIERQRYTNNIKIGIDTSTSKMAYEKVDINVGGFTMSSTEEFTAGFGEVVSITTTLNLNAMHSGLSFAKNKTPHIVLTPTTDGQFEMLQSGFSLFSDMVLSGSYNIAGPTESVTGDFSLSFANDKRSLYYRTLDALSYPESVTLKDIYAIRPFATFESDGDIYSGMIDGIDYTTTIDNLVFNQKSNTETTLTASVVPIPAAAWLFGSGLLGLIGLARRKANA